MASTPHTHTRTLQPTNTLEISSKNQKSSLIGGSTAIPPLRCRAPKRNNSKVVRSCYANSAARFKLLHSHIRRGRRRHRVGRLAGLGFTPIAPSKPLLLYFSLLTSSPDGRGRRTWLPFHNPLFCLLSFGLLFKGKVRHRSSISNSSPGMVRMNFITLTSTAHFNARSMKL